nr:hypothetical protein CPGR_00802 [Mycolicibacterium fortuitum subsp. fortuitum DSM 46621 = ATCC 6841 = JCM 6387]
MPTLQTAFPLPQVNHIAVTVGEHLDLDVTGPQYEPFQKEGVVAECGSCLSACTHQRRRKIGGLLHHPHTLATTARGRLDQDRETDLGRARDQLLIGEART